MRASTIKNRHKEWVRTFSAMAVCLALVLFADTGTTICNAQAPGEDGYWCDAGWPPAEGKDRTYGKDSQGNVCIKIMHTEAVCPEAPQTVCKESDTSEMIVSFEADENGAPIVKAVCPATKSYGLNKYDVEAMKLGYEQKLRTKNGKTYKVYEK